MLRKCRFLFSTVEGPKWMKFFTASAGLQINTDRSLKNDASESLNLYIKSNYRNFTPEQVLQAYSKRDLNYETHKLLELDFTERIMGNEKLSRESVIAYFNKEILVLPYNQLISSFLLLEANAIFDELTLFQQTNFMQLAIKVGVVSMPIYKKFLKNLKIDDEYFDSLTFAHYKTLIKLFDITSTSPYNLGLQSGFIDILINKYIQRLNNNELLAKELYRQDFQNIVLSFKPQILTSEQLYDIKQSYAIILEKLVTKDYNFLFSKNIAAREILSKIYWLYDPNEYHLLQKSLPVLLNGKPEKSETIMCQILKHFKLFAPNFYYNQLKTCQKQYSSQYNYRVDLRSINFLLTGNGITALQSILRDSQEVSDTLGIVLRILTSIINHSKDDDLLNFDEVFSASMELDGNQDFNESEYQDLASASANQALIKSKDAILQVEVRNFIERVERKWENITQEFTKQGYVRFFITKNSKKIYCLEQIFLYLEALSYLSHYQPETKVSTKIFQTQKFLLLLKHLVYMPNFFEQIVAIKKTWPHLFSQENSEFITQIKEEIDSLYNNVKSPQEFIDNIESQIKSSQIDSYTPGKFSDRQCYSLIQSFNFAKQKPHQIISKDLKNPYQEYTITETYSSNLRNKLFFVSYRSDIIVQHTHLKELVWKALCLDNQSWLMNYSDFPYLVDFICEKQKIVVFLEEYPRIIKGLGKVHTYETDRAADYYRKKDYQVYFLDYKTYHPNPQEMLNILKQQFVEATVICSNCKQSISESKHTLHEIYCIRNCVKCNKCGHFYDKNDPESHEEEYHKKTICQFCKQEFDDISRHKCTKKLKQCPYCELQFQQDIIVQHENQCGSRTEKCNVCNTYVMIKDLAIHQTTCVYRPKVEAPIIQNKPAQQEIYDKPKSRFDDNYDQQKYNNKISKDVPTQFQPQQKPTGQSHVPKLSDAKLEQPPQYQPRRQPDIKKDKIVADNTNSRQERTQPSSKPGSSSGQRPQQTSKPTYSYPQANNYPTSKNSYGNQNNKQETTQFDNKYEKNKYEQSRQSQQPQQPPQQQPPPQQPPQQPQKQRPLDSFKPSVLSNVPRAELKRPDTAIAREFQQQMDIEACGMTEEEMIQQAILMDQIEQQKKQQTTVKKQPPPEPEDDIWQYMTEEEKKEQMLMMESIQNKKYK